MDFNTGSHILSLIVEDSTDEGMWETIMVKNSDVKYWEIKCKLTLGMVCLIPRLLQSVTQQSLGMGLGYGY